MFDKLKSINWRKVLDFRPVMEQVKLAIVSVDWKNRTLVGVTTAVGLSVFGAGFLAAKVLQPHTVLDGPNHLSTESIAGSNFGHPRDARAARASDVRPEGFQVWHQNLDTSGNAPKACLQMS